MSINPTSTTQPSTTTGEAAGRYDEFPDEVANDDDVDATVVAGNPAGRVSVPVKLPGVPATVQLAYPSDGAADAGAAPTPSTSTAAVATETMAARVARRGLMGRR